MKVVSLCPLRAMGLVYTTSSGTFAELVIVKATFLLQPTRSVLAPEQDELNEDDNHWNDDMTRSVYAPSDRAPFKPKADITVVGHAFAPRGEPVRSLVARLMVGSVDKPIEIWCDRGLRPVDGQIFEGQRFSKMPLRWERAAGGPDSDNPVGINLYTPPDKYGMVAIPNLQMPGASVTKQSDILQPIGYGPIAETWRVRRAKFGRYADTLGTSNWDQNPLPDDLDYRCFQVAPEDQQLSQIRPDERIVLENLHPAHPMLVTCLPGIEPSVTVERASGEHESVVLTADSMWIDTDRAYCTVVWRGRIGLRHAEEAGQIKVSLDHDEIETTSSELPVQEVSSPHLNAPAQKSVTVVDSTSMLNVSELVKQRPATLPIPFHGTPPPPRSSSPQASHPSTSALPFVRPPPPRSSQPEMAIRDEASYAPGISPANNAPILSDPSSDPYAGMGPATAPPKPSASQMMAAVSPPPLVQPPTETRPASGAAPVSPWAGGAKDLGAAAVVLIPQPSGAAAAPLPKAPLPSHALSTPSLSGPVPVQSLIWYHDESVARFRRVVEWKPILKDLERKPKDKDLDDPALAKDPMEMEERREVFEILTHGSPKHADTVQQAYLDAIREDGKYVPPLILLEGELSFPFDELETLKATMTTVSPLVTPNDENLRVSLETAKEFLKTPGLSCAPAVSDGLTARIKDSFGQGKRNVPPGYVDTQTERVLLEQRHYQKRSVFGGKFIRSLLSVAGSSSPLPVYIPDELSTKLPMYQHFRAKLIAEINQQEDQYETHSLALRVLALSRVTPPPKR